MMPDQNHAESVRTENRKRALERLRRDETAPRSGLIAEAEASLCSAFALADLLQALRNR